MQEFSCPRRDLELKNSRFNAGPKRVAGIGAARCYQTDEDEEAAAVKRSENEMRKKIFVNRKVRLARDRYGEDRLLHEVLALRIERGMIVVRHETLPDGTACVTYHNFLP